MVQPCAGNGAGRSTAAAVPHRRSARRRRRAESHAADGHARADTGDRHPDATPADDLAVVTRRGRRSRSVAPRSDRGEKRRPPRTHGVRDRERPRRHRPRRLRKPAPEPKDGRAAGVDARSQSRDDRPDARRGRDGVGAKRRAAEEDRQVRRRRHVHERAGGPRNRGRGRVPATAVRGRPGRRGGEADRQGSRDGAERRSPPVQAARRDGRDRPVRQHSDGPPAGNSREATTRATARGGRSMKATCWMGRNKVEVENVPDPKILNDRDAIVRITSTAICGSDLHLYDGYIPSMKRGDVLGHEFMGEVVDKGNGVANLNVGDRVVVPFPIARGNCWACKHELYSLCENSNPNARLAEKMFGFPTAGIFGYSHLTGGFAGGQAEYARGPFADVGPIKIENGISDEAVLFLSDILPTGYMGAEFCEITGGEVIAVWGAGPVGQFAAASAKLLGADRVILIDRFDYRLRIARENLDVETLNYEEVDSVPEALKELTGGRGPDACIDAVGLEAHYHGPAFAYDRVKQALRQETERPIALREAIMSCRNGGIVSVIGVYGGLMDKFPIGAVMNRGLTIKSGQCHVHRYMKPLLERIQNGEIDPTFIVTHRIPLSEATRGYELLKKKQAASLRFFIKP